MLYSLLQSVYIITLLLPMNDESCVLSKPWCLHQVANNLCTPKNGEILVASTQDFLTSSYLFTRKDTFYDRAAFTQACVYMGDAAEPIDLPTPCILKVHFLKL